MVQPETLAHKIEERGGSSGAKMLTSHKALVQLPSTTLVLVVYVGNLLLRGGGRGIRSLRSFLVT